ncbi:MAG: FtsX-like permease family protein, partial [Thermoanaerobaculales bacterium]
VQIFPTEFIEVAPRSVDLDLFALRLDLGRDTLDAAAIEDLAEIPGVDAVFPKMRLMVPALASGGTSLFGAGMQTEIVADGIDPGLVSADIGAAFHEVVRKGRGSEPCSRDRECGEGSYCDRWSNPGEGVCRPFIPVLISPFVVELYNGAFRRAYRMPKINPDALRGLKFEMVFGASTIRPSAAGAIRERMQLVGVSDKAIPLGVTLPLGEIRRINAALASAEASERFHSAVLEVGSKERLAGVVEAAEALNLEVRDRGARRAALVTAVVMLVVALVGIAVVVVATAHIMHVFFLVVMMRRREIGLLRAVGARRGDIRALLLAEGATVGFGAGAVGVLAARAAGHFADQLAAGRVPDFPFKPDSFFDFSPWIVGSALALAVTACALGALAPAARAAAGDPSDALAGR